MTGWRYLNVSRLSPEPCLVSITNSETTSSSEHKLKVSTMMLSTRGEVVEGEGGSMLSHAMKDTQNSLLTQPDLLAAGRVTGRSRSRQNPVR